MDGEKELDFVVHETYIKGTVIQSKNFQGITWNQLFHPSKYIVCSDSSEKSEREEMLSNLLYDIKDKGPRLVLVQFRLSNWI